MVQNKANNHTTNHPLVIIFYYNNIHSRLVPGECLFTHLFFTKMRLNYPKTNPKRQRKCVFVIVNVQERISRKMTKNKQKPAKTSTRVDWVHKVKESQSWAQIVKRDPQSLKICKNDPWWESLKKWQDWSLKFQYWHIQSLMEIFEEKVKVNPQAFKFVIISPWILFWQNQSLEFH